MIKTWYILSWKLHFVATRLDLGLWCLMPLSTIFELYHAIHGRCTRYSIMWSSLSVTCARSVVFSRYSSFLHQYNWPPWYDWNIAESGIKHHNPKSNCLYPAYSTVLASSQLTTIIHWPCYYTVYVMLSFIFVVVCGLLSLEI